MTVQLWLPLTAGTGGVKFDAGRPCSTGCRPEVSVVATHALFVGPALARLQALPIQQLIATDSVDTTAELPAHFQVVNVAPLIADAIGRLHRNQSLEPIVAHA